MMFNWKRLVGIVGLIAAIIIIDIVLHSVIAGGIPTDILTYTMVILIIALVSSPAYDFFRLKRKQNALYPELKHRALEVAKKKRGIVVKGELGKMPSEWYGWFVKKLEADGLVMKNPNDDNQILFLEIVAETHTEDEIIEMNLPMEVGSKILRIKEDKGKKSEE
ncbi:hypothetical protein ES703_04455 [subsurface metagenome]